MRPSPQRIGRYDIVEPLGIGGMATVFRAVDPTLKRDVALKLLTYGSPDSHDRFLREARVLGTLDHPNIVRTYDVGEHEGQPFLVMELVQGITLAQLMRAPAPMPLLQRLDVIVALARALAYAHARGVVHRDVKPQNIIIDAGGVTRLIDFGIALMDDVSVTQVGMLAGTPQDMSPEQIRGATVDGRSDIFSAGLVLYELLASVRAFDGEDLPSVMFAIVSSEPVPLSARLPALGEFDLIVSKALTKAPADRYHTATELADDLAAIRSRLERSPRIDEIERALVPHWGTPRAPGSAPTPSAMTYVRLDRVARPAPAPVKSGSGLLASIGRIVSRWFSGRDAGSYEPKRVPPAPLPPSGGKPSPLPAPEPTSLVPVPLPLPAQAGPPAMRVPPPLERPAPAPVHARGEDNVHTVLVPASQAADVVTEEGPHCASADGTIVISSKALLDDARVQARLVIVRSPDARRAGRTVEIGDLPFTIGRSAEAMLEVADPGWSRTHACIDFVDDSYVIRDFGSANGTYLNGRRIAGQQPLFFGAAIRIADTVFTFTSGQDLTMPDLSGVEVAGRYVLRRLIRESGKAVMYAARDTHVPREVAAKLLSPALVRFAGYREQFAREAETASQLQHPNICRLLDSGQALIPIGGGRQVQTPFLCFDMMAGGDLAERLGKLSEVGLDQVTGWIDRLGSALDYAHERGVVHGGLKPTAVVFDQAGHVYLTDFAIAQRALNTTGQPLIGSPAYIAPEQWESGAVTPSTDQFAFAVIAYCLIAGARPFEGMEDPEVRAQQFRRGPEAAHEVAARNGRPALSRVVSEVLKRALSTSPEGRYATAGQFAAALTKALKEGRRFGNNPQIFLSYDREQSGGWARYFADKLREKHGIRVFMDTTGIDRAGRFPPRLVTAIEDCDVFVCFLAGSTLTSKWVNEEIRLAHEHQKVMIPVFQESYNEGSIDSGSGAISELISFQGIKLFDVSGHYVDHAVSDLAEMIKGSLREG